MNAYELAHVIHLVADIDDDARGLADELGRRDPSARVVGLRAGALLRRAYALYDELSAADPVMAASAVRALRGLLERGIRQAPRRPRRR